MIKKYPILFTLIIILAIGYVPFLSSYASNLQFLGVPYFLFLIVAQTSIIMVLLFIRSNKTGEYDD